MHERFDPPIRHPKHRFGDRLIDFDTHIAVMAIVNRTPDSFFDHGRTYAFEAAVRACVDAVDAGADFVDIGGVKFAPGPELSPNDEAERVVPVVSAVLEQRPAALLSIDTFQPLVARRALEAGAVIINDTTGLQNEELAGLVAEHGAHLVITHSLAAPRQPLLHPRYDDVASEVRDFLASRLERASTLGLDERQIIVDPGHDLNKNTNQTLELTRNLRQITDLGVPTLAAVSNKDFIGESLDRARDEREAGSIAAATVCAMLGARILRMHNTRDSLDAMRMVEAILGHRAPEHPVHNM